MIGREKRKEKESEREREREASLLLTAGLIQPGDAAVYLPFVMGRHPAIWDEPLVFNPKRWLDPQGDCHVFLGSEGSVRISSFFFRKIPPGVTLPLPCLPRCLSLP